MNNRNNFLENGVVWTEDFDLVFLFEIETKKILSFLPKGIMPVEIRPGIASIFLSSLNFPKGNLSKFDSFKEINWAIIVHPDLKVKMPLPKFCFFMCNVSAADKDFLDYANTVDKMPIRYSESLQVEMRESGYTKASDSDGDIYALQAEVPTKDFRKKDIWGQSVLMQEDKLYLQAWRWQGYAMEYQKNISVGKVYSHPYFKGLDVNNLGDNCYIQMLSQPGKKAYVTFYEPQLIRDKI